MLEARASRTIRIFTNCDEGRKRTSSKKVVSVSEKDLTDVDQHGERWAQHAIKIYQGRERISITTDCVTTNPAMYYREMLHHTN